MLKIYSRLGACAVLVAIFSLVGCDSADLDSTPVDPATSGVDVARATDDVIPGQYIVVLDKKPAATDARAAAALQEVTALVSARTDASISLTYRNALTGFAAELSDQAVEALRKDPRVRYIEPDKRVWAIGTQSNATWGLDRTDQRSGTDGSYTYNATGAGVTAYIIDTGIRTSHNDFGGQATVGYDAIGDGENGQDCNGHGTHVAGTVGGTEWGVAKDVDLVAIRVLDCQGSGTTSGVIAGVDWVTENKVLPAVANMSLGGGASSSLDQAVQNSIASGVSYAVAAGNGDFIGREQDACNYSPARVPEAMTVSATDNSDIKATWANYGSCVDWFSPGVSITSAWIGSDSDTNTISGTSMAAPHTAGIAALYLEGAPGADAQTVRNAIYNETTKSIVSDANTANNHLTYSLNFGDGSGEGGTTNSPPTADFTYGTTDLTVDFTDQSSDSDGSIASWSWDFGDGSTSTVQNPSHTYASGGTYTVTLTVTDDAGATDSASHSVSVSDGTTAGITLSASPRTAGPWSITDLTWSPADGGNVEVLRDGTSIGITADDGAESDRIGRNETGSFTYSVCETDSGDCSNEVTVTF